MKDVPSTLVDPEGASAPEGEAEEERWVRCGTCRSPITRVSARIRVNGAHEHEFMNPQGIRFRVGCYASAPGCRAEGERSGVWTWFPGYEWQIELCRSCLEHLGWSFHADGKSPFYGLVQDKLVSTSAQN